MGKQGTGAYTANSLKIYTGIIVPGGAFLGLRSGPHLVKVNPGSVRRRALMTYQILKKMSVGATNSYIRQTSSKTVLADG